MSIQDKERFWAHQLPFYLRFVNERKLGMRTRDWDGDDFDQDIDAEDDMRPY